MGRDRFVWTRKSGSNNNKMVQTLKDCRCVNKHIKKKYQRAYNSRCHPLRDMEFKLSHFYVLKINAPGIKAYRDFFSFSIKFDIHGAMQRVLVFMRRLWVPERFNV